LQATLVTPNPNWRPDLGHFQMRSVAFLPDGRSFVSGHEDGLVRVWDSETGGLISSLKGSSAAIWSVAAAPGGQQVAAGAADGSVLVWNLETGDEVARLSPRDVPVSCLRWSPRGDRLAISLGDFSDAVHAALLVWTADDSSAELEFALDKPVGALAWLDDGQTILAAGWDGEGQLWNLERRSPSIRLQLDKNTVKAANWSPDCPLVPSGWFADHLLTGAP
jgi:WD40 repeat protein